MIRPAAARRPRPAEVLVLVVLALTVVLVGGAVRARPAWACSCAQVPDSEAFGRSTAVFTGTVKSVTRRGKASTDPALYVFDVDAVAKGSVARSQDVVTEQTDAGCGVEFTVGSRYVVYGQAEGSANVHPYKGQLYSGACDGSRVLEKAAAPPPVAASWSPPTGATANPVDPTPIFVVVGVASALVTAALVGVLIVRRRAG